MEDEIDVKCLLLFFWKRKKILLCISIAFLLLVNLSFFCFNGLIYSSEAKVRISNEATNNIITSYNDLLVSDSVVDKAMKNSNVSVKKSDLKRNLFIRANEGSTIYTITFNYKNKTEGRKFFKEIVDEFIDKVELFDGSYATIFEAVKTSDKPINFSLVKNELLYAAAGVAISFGYVFVIFLFDKKIKSEIELDKYNVLGVIDKSEKNLSLLKNKIKLINSGKVIFLNGVKEIDCSDKLMNLVKEFANGSRVLFIDANIRNKSKKMGYSDLLKQYKEDFSKYIMKNNGFDLMECGTNNKETETLLFSDNNKKIIDSLKKKYDYILIYNSSFFDYSDSLIISKVCDSNYIIVELNKTEKKDFERMLALYKQVNSEINGIILVDNQ